MIGEFLSALWSLFKYAIEVIASFFYNSFIWIFDYCYYLVLEFCNWIQSIFAEMIEKVLNNPFGDFVIMSADLLQQVNYFLPLMEFCIILLILLQVWIYCLVVKIILKLIPTIY